MTAYPPIGSYGQGPYGVNLYGKGITVVTSTTAPHLFVDQRANRREYREPVKHRSKDR